MAHNNYSNGINNNPHRMDNYEYELKRLMEQERRSMAVQQQLSRENAGVKSQYYPSIDEIYPNVHIDQRLLPVRKPLRIIIIRHAERADAVLGSDWSKKSFDRTGRYIRFSEHLPDALPTRSYLHHYVIDVPLTNRGRIHAFKTGKALLSNGYAADICYTSPSLRCVQSADGILNGMGRKDVPMQLEPGLFECYLNDFKRTLCFMTKDELASNGYNIDKSYQSLMPFMRPHDSQLDYYERCRMIMDVITDRHQVMGGTILIVAHAPSLEGLTRHLSGGKVQPEKLFDIARRVPFLAMTIVEKNNLDSPWLFRTQPLQAGATQSIHEISLQLAQPPTPVPIPITHHPIAQQKQQPQQQQQQKHTTAIQITPIQSQRIQPNQILPARAPTGPISIDPRKVVKSSTAPNLPTSNSLSEMFRVI
jgi:broad specificity phosphatase PhoE